MFPGSHVPQPCFHGRNPEKDLPQALGLDRQLVRQTCTLTLTITITLTLTLTVTLIFMILPNQIQSHGPAGSAKVVLTATAAGWNSNDAMMFEPWSVTHTTSFSRLISRPYSVNSLRISLLIFSPVLASSRENTAVVKTVVINLKPVSRNGK